MFEAESERVSIYTPAIEKAVRENSRLFPSLSKNPDDSIPDPAAYDPQGDAQAVDIYNFEALRDPLDSNQNSFIVQIAFDVLFFA